MADTKLSALTELAAIPAVDDEVYIRDVSEAAANESKRITIANLLAGSGAYTIMVAASDATDREKASALASGGTVCDGTDDGADIEAAIAIIAASMGTVQLSTGTFVIDDGDLAINKCTVRGHGATNIFVFAGAGTILELDGNADFVWLKEDGRLHSVTIKKTATNFTGKALYVAGDMIGGTVTALRDRQMLTLYDIQITGGDSDEADMTGTGILFEVENGTTYKNYMELCTMSDIHVQGFSTGIKIVVTRDTGDAANAFWNGNVIDKVIITSCEYPVELETNGALSPELQGNVFPNWIINGCGGMIDGITLDDNSVSGNIWRNIWTGFFFWDEGEISGDGLTASGNSMYNHVIGKVLDAWQGTPTNNNNIITGLTDVQARVFGDYPTYNWLSGTKNVGAHGDIVRHQCGETIVSGELCYLKSDDEFWKTDADAEATSRGMLGIALEDGTDGSRAHFLLRGIVRIASEVWATRGGDIYISTTPGDMTHTAPSGAGDIIRIVGQGFNIDNVMYFNPSTDYFEHDGTGISKINGILLHIA